LKASSLTGSNTGITGRADLLCAGHWLVCVEQPRRQRAMRETFSEIYRTNAWDGIESLSGPGSGPAATHELRELLPRLVDDLSIRTVIDVACGDGYWMPELPGYVGIDVAPEAIKRARKLHPTRAYVVGDVATMSLPRNDLVIVRDVIQHLSFADGLALLSSILRSQPRYLLASTYQGGANTDIQTGDAYCPDLTAPPFSLPRPERMIFDGYHYHETDELRDPRKHLGLWYIGG